jgi:MFS family permease
MLAGGVVADRFGPRRIAVASDTTRCLVIGAVAATILLTSPGIGLLIAAAIVFGVVDALFMPAVGALPPRITTTGQLARLQGLRGLSIRLSNAVGPALAGVVLAAGDAPAAFGTASALFAISLVLLLAVRTTPAPAAPRVPAWRGLGEGLRYLRGHRVLAPLVVVVGLSEMCFSGPVALGLVLLADERGWGAAGMGWIASAFSVGGAAAALLIAARSRIPRAGLVATGALLATAAGTAGIGFAPTLPLAVLLGGSMGLTSGVTSTLTSALVQTEADPGHRRHHARHAGARADPVPRGRPHRRRVGTGRVLHRLRRDLPGRRRRRPRRPRPPPGRTAPRRYDRVAVAARSSRGGPRGGGTSSCRAPRAGRVVGSGVAGAGSLCPVGRLCPAGRRVAVGASWRCGRLVVTGGAWSRTRSSVGVGALR